jgi:hypothetical protein
MKVTISTLLQSSSTTEQIIDVLRRTEPFRSNWEATEALLDELIELEEE